MSQPLSIAHRGHSSAAPEQTMAAFSRAVGLRVDMLELDVRVSADGTLVLMHDRTVDRTTNGHGDVSAHTDEKLLSLDAGSWYSPEFADERVPLLSDAFELAEASNIGLCIEVKGESHQEQAALAVAIAHELDARGRLKRDVVAGFDHAALAEATRTVPGVRVAPDRLPERGKSTAGELIDQAASAGATIIQHHCDDLSRDVVDAVQAEGIAIWAWPATTRNQIHRMLELGVAGIMGDDAQALVELIGHHTARRQ